MRIFCFGDSNTYGYDPRGYWGGRYAPQDRWVDLLAKKTGWDLINHGQNGRTIPHSFQPAQPVDWIILMLGTNDLLQGASAAETAARMDALLQRLNQRNVLLVAPPPMKYGAWVSQETLIQESAKLAAAYADLAQRYQIPFADASEWNVELAFDGVHFTEAGHHTFADCITLHFLKISP